MNNSFVGMSGDPYHFFEQIREQGLDISLGVPLPLKYAEKKLTDALLAARVYHEELASYKQATYEKVCRRHGEAIAQEHVRLLKPFNPASWMHSQLDQMGRIMFELSTSFTKNGTSHISGKVYSAFVDLGKAFDLLAYQAYDKGTREVVWWNLHSYAGVNQTDRVTLPEEATPLLQVVTRMVQVPYGGVQRIFPVSTVLGSPPPPTSWLDAPQTYTSE